MKYLIFGLVFLVGCSTQTPEKSFKVGNGIYISEIRITPMKKIDKK